MKAISLWQPWASLFACGRKMHETRHWPTDHRGHLLVHAAKKICIDVDPALDRILMEQFGTMWRRSLPAGALVGACNLIDCIPTDLVRVDDEERAQGNYGPGRYAWEAADAYAFEQPIPYRGAQGFFNVPLEVVAAMLNASSTATPPASPQGTLL